MTSPFNRFSDLPIGRIMRVLTADDEYLKTYIRSFVLCVQIYASGGFENDSENWWPNGYYS